ncbi:hypothetical protein ABW20_dc0107852 [Dactylellina cionopaga]|nr:hypothetical protein ABW20_dc0107852 [Dactylellina cionopaga]
MAEASFNSLMGVSSSYLWGTVEIAPAQSARLNQLLQTAKARGLGSMIWGTPTWPTAARRAAWKVLVDAQVSLIYVDDLQDAANGEW